MTNLEAARSADASTGSEWVGAEAMADCSRTAADPSSSPWMRQSTTRQWLRSPWHWRRSVAEGAAVPSQGARCAQPVAVDGSSGRWSRAEPRPHGRTYWAAKRAIDVMVAALLLPFVAILAAVIWLLNPLLNPGPLFFSQTRMGRWCEPFVMVKFRTMLPASDRGRGPNDPVEHHRITRFGQFLRRTRLDETPQLLHVLAGKMSLVGPRPDMYDHSVAFIASVPGYKRRHAVRPGITGYAQVMSGYAEGCAATRRKVSYDLLYIRRSCWKLEMIIVSRTVVVMLSGFGAR